MSPPGYNTSIPHIRRRPVYAFNAGGPRQRCKKGNIQVVKSGGDPAKPFELLEETLNQMTLFNIATNLPAKDQKR